MSKVGGLGVHEVHNIEILHSSFDPLTTKFGFSASVMLYIFAL